MSYYAFLAIGLLAGVIAKRFLPTRRQDDWVAPLFVGALGALFGGWLGSVLFWSSTSNPFSTTFSLRVIDPLRREPATIIRAAFSTIMGAMTATATPR